MTRQERRARLKENLAAVAKRGIDLAAPRPDKLWRVIACTRLLMDTLEGKSPARASEAARRAHEFFEVSLKYNPCEHRIACAKGCGFCCHLRVSAMAPEIFLLANHIRREFKDTFDAVLSRLREADANSRGLSGRERAQHHFPCGMLVEGACSVYAARPSACRALTSISVETCKRGYEGEEVQVMTPAVWTEIRGAHNQALWAALVHAGLPYDAYELNHALLVALETRDAEARWLKGEDVFAGVDREREDQEGEALKKRICERLIAGAMGREMPPLAPA
jgi:Fe-S-cluster containining protein